jgi:hypothetical protein
LIFAPLIAYGFVVWYDVPVRRWLTAAWQNKMLVKDPAGMHV